MEDNSQRVSPAKEGEIKITSSSTGAVRGEVCGATPVPVPRKLTARGVNRNNNPFLLSHCVHVLPNTPTYLSVPGRVDAAAAYSMFWPKLKDKVVGLVLVQSPHGGNPIAPDILCEVQIADVETCLMMEVLICKIIKNFHGCQEQQNGKTLLKAPQNSM